MKIDEDQFRAVGLRPRHAYSVLDVRDLEGIRLVRMRNPWGHYSWSGDWSDHSPIWTPELRDMLLSGGGDDGVFWIAFQDVLLYFDCIDICKVRLGWSEVRLSGTLPPFSSKPHQSATLLTVLHTAPRVQLAGLSDAAASAATCCAGGLHSRSTTAPAPAAPNVAPSRMAHLRTALVLHSLRRKEEG